MNIINWKKNKLNLPNSLNPDKKPEKKKCLKNKKNKKSKINTKKPLIQSSKKKKSKEKFDKK